MSEKELLREPKIWFETYPFLDKNQEAYEQIKSRIVMLQTQRERIFEKIIKSDSGAIDCKCIACGGIK